MSDRPVEYRVEKDRILGWGAMPGFWELTGPRGAHVLGLRDTDTGFELEFVQYDGKVRWGVLEWCEHGEYLACDRDGIKTRGSNASLAVAMCDGRAAFLACVADEAETARSRVDTLDEYLAKSLDRVSE